jgi:DNA repair protein RecO (recombination protein O)
MEWREPGLVLGGRRFGETDVVLDVFTRDRGRRRGLVYGGMSRAKRAALEPGNTLMLEWRGRLEEQLGHFSIAEVSEGRAARLLADPLALSAAASITGLLSGCLSESEPVPGLYDAAVIVLDALGTEARWPAMYVRFEVGILSAMGFGMDLSACALGGEADDLGWVSPRSGRAASRAAVAAEGDGLSAKLLALPRFLTDIAAPAEREDVLAGLALTGHFLEQRLFSERGRLCPPAREALVERLRRTAPATAIAP